jgi:hypothetical protein
MIAVCTWWWSRDNVSVVSFTFEFIHVVINVKWVAHIEGIHHNILKLPSWYFPAARNEKR